MDKDIPTIEKLLCTAKGHTTGGRDGEPLPPCAHGLAVNTELVRDGVER